MSLYISFQPTCVLFGQIWSSCCEQPWSHYREKLWKLPSLHLRVHRKSHRAMATEAPESHSWNEVEYIDELFAKNKPAVCQKGQAFFLLTVLLPLTSLFYLLISLYFLPLSSHVFTNSYLHSLACVHTLLLLPLSSQIMVLTDPEFESSVLISSDEGASYQKYRLAFYVLSLLFHPTEEDWALAYSHDQKVRLHLMS